MDQRSVHRVRSRWTSCPHRNIRCNDNARRPPGGNVSASTGIKRNADHKENDQTINEKAAVKSGFFYGLDNASCQGRIWIPKTSLILDLSRTLYDGRRAGVGNCDVGIAFSLTLELF